MKHSISSLLIVSGIFSITSCNTDISNLANNVATHLATASSYTGAASNAVAIPAAQAPASIAGKRIILDYSAAKTSIGDSSNYPEIKWGPWTPNEGGTTIIPTFNQGNIAKTGPINSEDCTVWKYTKTGSNTVDLKAEAHEYNETFTLTFDTPTSGSATGGTADDCSGYSRVEGIRFIIK